MRRGDLKYLALLSKRFYDPGTEKDRERWWDYVKERSGGYLPDGERPNRPLT